MHRPTRHLRGLLVALAALALSAGVVFAARPASAPPAEAADGLQRAAEAAGTTVPTTVEQPGAPAEDPDQDEDADEDAPTPDAPTADAGTHPLNHGWYVSQAAQAETPAGFDNHGAYVSSIAKGDMGKPDAAAASRTGKDTAASAKAAAAQRKALRQAQRQTTGH